MKEITLKHGYIIQVDDDDFERVSKHSWHYSKKCFGRSFGIQSNINGKNTYLPRFIMNPPANMVVDHRDRNPFNNQKSNLRICTRSENQRNKRLAPKTSKYTGVSIGHTKHKFVANIRANGKCKVLGTFDTEIEAARAYNEAAIKYHGEFACLNEIPDEKAA